MLSARREGSLNEVAELCIELGSPKTIVVPVDVAKVEDCRRIVDATITHFGRCMNIYFTLLSLNSFGSLFIFVLLRPF